MRLILSNNSLRKPAPLTPEAIFESKYDWLLRWAMHFTQNDREAAEDLVQDAFVRLVTSWPRIKENVEQVEPVLYSYLKYCYLTEIRRGQRFNLQELVLIEFDDLRLSLQEEKTADSIEVQDDLRRIIVVMPFLNILDQTAKDYRAVFSEPNGFDPHTVLEAERINSGEKQDTSAWHFTCLV